MPHTLDVEPKGSYLHCTVRGTNDRETVLAYWAEIRDACRTRDCYRVLVEEWLDGPQFPPEVLLPLMGEVVMASGVTFEAVAYVDMRAESDLIRRAADRVIEPGQAVGVFGTVAEAESWLRGRGRPG